MNIYRHVLPEEHGRAAAALERRYAPPTGTAGG
jgi:hypothetical protein